MRRSVLLLVTIPVVIAIAANGCAGSRPSLAEAQPPSTTVDLTNVAKIANTDPNTADSSLVASAVVASVNVYDAPNVPNATRTLKNPNTNGAPLVFLVDQAQAGWLRVLLPVRPNGSTGWIKATDVKLSRHNFRIEVRLTDFRILVTRGTQIILDAPIGVAMDNTPTPGGRYYTTELLKPPTDNTVYGAFAYGLSGFSEAFDTFNGGPGQLGIHGTNDPSSIGKKVSHGCVRLRNEDISKLAAILPLGVPVTIVK